MQRPKYYLKTDLQQLISNNNWTGRVVMAVAVAITIAMVYASTLVEQSSLITSLTFLALWSLYKITLTSIIDLFSTEYKKQSPFRSISGSQLRQAYSLNIKP
ncbi:MAG: hypothetical protein M3O33_20800 [Cyanobacteriota bacterium]|nr:hypothetical protein [Cyanobacteriota bacterium]